MHSELSASTLSEYRDIYQRDGVVLVKKAFETRWIDLLLSGWSRIQDLPDEDIYDLPDHFLQEDPLLRREIESIKSSSATERAYYREQTKGFVRYKYMYWWAPEFRTFVHDSPAAELIANIIGADHVRYFVDAIFMKEAACDAKTYWHSDEPAWPVKGDQVPTMWMPLLPVDAELSSLEYIAGSHKNDTSNNPWPNTFNAKMLGQPDDRPSFYDWEKRRSDADVQFLAFDMDPGDVVLLHPKMLHGGGANLHPTQSRIAYSTRWFGDDVRWDPKPECVNTPGLPLKKMEKGSSVVEDEAFPLLWNRNKNDSLEPSSSASVSD